MAKFGWGEDGLGPSIDGHGSDGGSFGRDGYGPTEDGHGEDGHDGRDHGLVEVQVHDVLPVGICVLIGGGRSARRTTILSSSVPEQATVEVVLDTKLTAKQAAEARRQFARLGLLFV